MHSDRLPAPWVQTLANEYFADEGLSTFAIIDGASIEGLVDRLYDDEPDYLCLMPGALEPDMAEVAPYLVRLRNGDAFTRWVLDYAFGHHWGVVLRSASDAATLERRYRRLLRVRGPEGDPLFFRFYDPRVLRVFLPTCESGEINEWFDGVSDYFVESSVPCELLRFSSGDGRVNVTELKLPPVS